MLTEHKISSNEDNSIPLVDTELVFYCLFRPSLLLRVIKLSVFHLSTHFFAVSLNLLRSSNEQGCARSVHCIMCAVFSVAKLHSQVVSPS